MASQNHMSIAISHFNRAFTFVSQRSAHLELTPVTGQRKFRTLIPCEYNVELDHTDDKDETKHRRLTWFPDKDERFCLLETLQSLFPFFFLFIFIFGLRRLESL